MFGKKDIDEYDLSSSLRKQLNTLDGLIRWPSITEGLTTFKGFVKDLAREAMGGEVKQLREEIKVVRAENQLLLDHLGLTIVTVGTKEIRKKYTSKKAVTKKEKTDVKK